MATFLNFLNCKILFQDQIKLPRTHWLMLVLASFLSFIKKNPNGSFFIFIKCLVFSKPFQWKIFTGHWWSCKKQMKINKSLVITSPKVYALKFRVSKHKVGLLWVYEKFSMKTPSKFHSKRWRALSDVFTYRACSGPGLLVKQMAERARVLKGTCG